MTNPDDIDFKDQVKRIMQLQELDGEIYELRLKKESFPVRIEEMDASLAEKKTGMNTAGDELKQQQVANNEKETDMQAKEEQIKKHEGELYQVKNNKEYTALQQEIQSIQADVSLLEEDIINLLDSIEAAKVKLEDEKKLFAEEEQSVKNEKESIIADEKVISAKLDEFLSNREEIASGVVPEILIQYDHILKSRGKTALAKVNEGFCGECNMQLRAQIVNEATLCRSIVACESCSRILYVEK